MKINREQHFYKNMISYLVDHQAYMDYLDVPKSGNDSCCDPHEIPYCINGRSFEEVMGEIIETLEASPYMDKDHFRQYTRVRILSLIKGNPTTQEIFRFLFDLCNDEVMSWPAYDILFDRFGDIMTAALRIASPCDLNDNAQAERLRALVYLLLSDYIPSDLQEDQLLIYGDGAEKSEESPNAAVFSEADEEDGVPLGHVNEDYFLLECCVTQVEKADFENNLDVDYIAAYADEGLHGENTLIENMITYVNRDDPRQAVTYQIIGKTYYDSAKEMIADLGAKAFGYTVHESSAVADLIDNAGEYDHGKGAQALWIKQLSYPIIRKADVKRSERQISSAVNPNTPRKSKS